jgi:hypothetical protein
MIKTYLLSLLGLISFSVQSQYCASAGPSSTADSNVQSVNLTGDGNSISYNGCPGVLGIQDLTNLSATLTGGNSYSLNVQFGTCQGNYAGVGEAWIDFNGDQVFDITESIGSWTGTPPSAISAFNFTVPAGITNGPTRMRVIQNESGSLPIDPCGTFTWGSVMDFTIILGGGIDCSVYVGNTTADPIIVNTFPHSSTNDNSFCYTNNNNAYASPDVFYLVIPNTETVEMSISLCGSSFDTYLSVFNTDGSTLTFNDDGSCGTQSEVTFSTVGFDSVFVVVEGWGNESGDYIINILETAVSEINNNKTTNFNISPNPASDYFLINGLTNRTVQIHDITGKLICTITNYSGEPINTTEYTKGIYFVSFENTNRKEVKKLIID